MSRLRRPRDVESYIVAGIGALSTAIGCYAWFKVAIAVIETKLEAMDKEVQALRAYRHHLAESITALQLDVIRLKSDAPRRERG